MGGVHVEVAADLVSDGRGDVCRLVGGVLPAQERDGRGSRRVTSSILDGAEEL